MAKINFKPDDWIDGFDGIGQIVSIHELPQEVFSPKIEDREIPVGEIYLTVAVYKILCNFEGKIRKRSRIQSCNASYCESISKDSLALVEQIRKNDTQAFRKYDECSTSYSENRWTKLWLNLPDKALKSVAEKIDSVKNKLPDEFTYNMYIEELSKTGLPFDTSEMHAMDETGNNNLVISLLNQDFKTLGKNIIFSMANCTMISKNV